MTGVMVSISRDLAERLLACQRWSLSALRAASPGGLKAAETPAGHLAQKVGHERLGYCGWRSESPRCVEHRLLVAELELALSSDVGEG